LAEGNCAVVRGHRWSGISPLQLWQNDPVPRIRADPADQQAWAKLYNLGRRHVLATLFFLGIRQPQLEELLSEAFFRFIVKSPWCHDWSTLPELTGVLKYLRGAAQSVASHSWARQRRQPSVSLEESGQEPATDDPGEAPFFSVEHVLTHLEPPEREFFERYYYLRMSLTQLALSYGISNQAAYNRLHRVRRKIVEIIREKPFGPRKK
jgi:DNA-directed RNA polymerase specialized sigma24 family protein